MSHDKRSVTLECFAASLPEGTPSPGTTPDGALRRSRMELAVGITSPGSLSGRRSPVASLDRPPIRRQLAAHSLGAPGLTLRAPLPVWRGGAVRSRAWCSSPPSGSAERQGAWIRPCIARPPPGRVGPSAARCPGGGPEGANALRR